MTKTSNIAVITDRRRARSSVIWSWDVRTITVCHRTQIREDVLQVFFQISTTVLAEFCLADNSPTYESLDLQVAGDRGPSEDCNNLACGSNTAALPEIFLHA